MPAGTAAGAGVTVGHVGLCPREGTFGLSVSVGARFLCVSGLVWVEGDATYVMLLTKIVV